MYSPPADQLKLAAVIGEKAESGPDFPLVKRRLVISQAGPGDEIMTASLYRALRARSDELIITCDPRLFTLFSRSFPDIQFVPVERLTAESVGWYGPDQTERAPNALHSLLTAEAYDLAAECDSVVLARSLPQLKVTQVLPAQSSYLQVRPDLVAAAGRASQYRRVGIVWRSEARSLMRDIHYLRVDDLAPLLDRTEQFVCLQHDVSDSERRTLRAVARNPVEFRDDIDLRDDFERTAALIAGLDAVVGIGTTATEMSAALGLPVVMMQPTHFGTWRSIDDFGSDYWHRSMRVVKLDEPWNRPLLVESAASMLDELLRS